MIVTAIFRQVFFSRIFMTFAISNDRFIVAPSRIEFIRTPVNVIDVEGSSRDVRANDVIAGPPWETAQKAGSRLQSQKNSPFPTQSTSKMGRGISVTSERMTSSRRFPLVRGHFRSTSSTLWRRLRSTSTSS